MKTFRIYHVPFGAPEQLAARFYAKGLSCAVKGLQRSRGLRLPDGVYYIFEEGHYADGLQITLPAGREIKK